MRAKLMQAIHAEGTKRGLDHDAIRDVCATKFGVRSMAELTEAQLKRLYRDWTGRTFRARGQAAPATVTAADLEQLEQAFALRGWGKDTRAAFIRRQIGRAEIRTRKELWRVFSGVRAMNRREGLCK